MAQKEFTQYYPKPGWVERDPVEIWSSQISVATEAMAKLGARADEITSIGITNQRKQQSRGIRIPDSLYTMRLSVVQKNLRDDR